MPQMGDVLTEGVCFDTSTEREWGTKAPAALPLGAKDLTLVRRTPPLPSAPHPPKDARLS
jgi:hypothetical protein